MYDNRVTFVTNDYIIVYDLFELRIILKYFDFMQFLADS